MNKLLKNKFISNTFILILSGMATKVLGLIIKILYTRIVGPDTINIYTIVMPTYSLLLTISNLAMPTTISKLVAENKSKTLLNSAVIIIIILNILLIILMIYIGPFIASNLLHEEKAYYLLISCTITLPFASLACILKGYYYGKQKMLPHVISNTVEQLIRILLIIFILPFLVKISYVYAACGLILTSFVTEMASIIVFILFMKKNEVINLAKIKFNRKDAKDIFSLSFPTVASRIIGNISYFFEPIILTNVLLKVGYTKDFILSEYGAYNAYAISTLSIPSFFISGICLALLPELTKEFANKNVKKIKKRLKESFIFAFIIGFVFALIMFIFRKEILLILYKTTKGENYIKYLSFVFILFYFEGIFSSFMQASGNPKISFKITVISSILKSILTFVLSFLKIGIYSLVIAEIVNIIVIIILDIYYVNRIIKKTTCLANSL